MKTQKTLIFLLALGVLLQACAKTAPPPAPENTQQPAASPSQPAWVAPENKPTATAPTDQPVAHVSIPATGISDRATAHDNENSLFFATKKVKSGDEFYKNRFERPFTAAEMNYLPDLDIVNFSISSDESFFYIKISMVGFSAGSQSLTGAYGIEMDHNADGRAEILLTTRPPYTTEFSAENTNAYLDVNGDVGGNIINRPDDFASDGFEKVIFDLSQGLYPTNDPDLIWARQTTDSLLPAVEIAVKKSIFQDGAEIFMWSALASGVTIDPVAFYYQDYFTAEEAGAANSDNPNYPIKQLAAFDNTCRVPWGFQATGSEPLGCFIKGGEVEAKATPTSNGANSTCGQFPQLCAELK
jgi:hypothetical protein